jgi:large subunit ribosomal protein L15
MQTHQLTSKNLNRPKKRVGRGGKRGTYSGHGGKGQTARAGANFRPITRDILKRYPKLRGYKNRPAQIKPEIINIEKLETRFENGQTVDPRALVEKKLAPRVSGRYPRIKILGRGSITKSLTVVGCEVSASARQAIEKAGGTIQNNP